MNFIEHIKGVVVGKLAIYKGLFSLIALEATLAKRSILPLLISFFLLVAAIFSLWLSFMFLLGYGLILLFHNALAGLSSLFLLNLVFVIAIAFYLRSNIRNVSFEKTRARLSNIKPT